MRYIFCGSTLHLNTPPYTRYWFFDTPSGLRSQFFSQTFFNSVIYFLFYACLKNLHENEQNCVGTKSFVINKLLKLFQLDHVPFSKKNCTPILEGQQNQFLHKGGHLSWRGPALGGGFWFSLSSSRLVIRPKRVGAGRVATTSPALKLSRFQLISFPESPQRRNWWLWNVSAKRISNVTELDWRIKYGCR